MEDLVDLCAEPAVKLRDDGLYVLDDVGGRDGRALERLLGQSPHCRLDLLACAVRLRLEFLAEERGEIAGLDRGGLRGGLGGGLLFGHGYHSLFFGSLSDGGFALAARD